MKQIILSNEEEANEELMWQPTTATATTMAATRAADCDCAVTGVSLSTTTLTLEVNESETLVATVAPDDATDNSVRWSSSKESVATVSASGLVCAKKAGTATITVETNDGGFTASCEVTVKPVTVDVTGVSISNTSLSLEVNGSYTLVATVSPSNASNPKVTWTSDNEAVATVSSGGLVCAKKAGTATITAETEDGGYARKCKVMVNEETVSVSCITLAQTSISMEENESYLLIATVSPSNATNTKVTWESSDETVATINTSGLICAKAPGSTKITATTEDGCFSKTCWVTVAEKGTLNKVAVTDVTVKKDGETEEEEDYHLLKMGESFSLTATVLPENATDKDVIWESSDETVVTVSRNGVLYPKREGKSWIRARTVDGNKSASYWVMVVPDVFVEGIQINKVCKEGNITQLEAVLTPVNATGEVEWSSSNTEIAYVDYNGVVTRFQSGEVTITAKARTTVKDVASFQAELSGNFVEDKWSLVLGLLGLTVFVSHPVIGIFGMLLGLTSCSNPEEEDAIPTATLSTNEAYEETEPPEETPDSKESPEGKDEDDISPKYVRIVGNGVCARSSPTTADDTNKILLLESDTYLKYLGKVSDEDGIPWYEVQLFDGVEGFVCSKYYDTTKGEWIILACVEEEVSANTVVDAQGNVLYYHCARPKNFKEYRMMVNALYIYDYLIVQSSEKEFKGLENKITFPKWTPNAIYGLLGNLAVESRMNPDNGGDATTGGYGLTQWTPRDDPDNPDKYIPWARENYADADATLWNMDWQLDRIRYEVYRDSVDPNGGQWHSDEYGAGMTFTQYIQSNNDAADLGEAFLRGYEKPEVIINGPDTEREKSIATRRRLAENWKEFFESNKQTLYVHEVE